MEEIVKVLVDNGVSVGCFLAFIYFIFVDKQEANDISKNTITALNNINDTLIKMQLNLQQLNDRVEKLEKDNK